MQGSVRKRGTIRSYRIDFGKIDGERRQIEKGGYKKLKCAFAGYCHGEIMWYPEQMAADIIDFLENNSEML